jgi:hypothetical protein
MTALLRHWLEQERPWAGVFAGPVAWAANQQVNYMLASGTCRLGTAAVVAVAIAFALIPLGGVWLSLRAWRRHGGPDGQDIDRDGQPGNFLAGLGVTLSLLFGLVIVMQAIAGLVFDGCER